MKIANHNMKTIIRLKSENRRISYLIKKHTQIIYEVNMSIGSNMKLMKAYLTMTTPDYALARICQSNIKKLKREEAELLEVRSYLRNKQKYNGEIILRNRSLLLD